MFIIGFTSHLLLCHVGILSSVPNDNLLISASCWFPTFSASCIQQITDLCRFFAVALSTCPVVAVKSVVDSSHFILLLAVYSVRLLFVLALFQVIFSQYEVFAASATYSLGNRIYRSFQVYLSFRVVEIGHLAVIIHINWNLGQRGASALVAEHAVGVHVEPIAALAEELEPFNCGDTHSIQVEQLEAHLNYDVLHRKIRSDEFDVLDLVLI